MRLAHHHRRSGALLRVTPRTVVNLCEAGQIKAVRVANRWRIHNKALLEQYGLI